MSEFGYAMAKDMTDFHQYVEKWSVSYQRDWYYNELSEPKNDQEMSIFQNLMYILETMRLLLPVHLQFELDDDFEKDNKIFAALCHFFPPWLFNIIQEIELNMSDICPGTSSLMYSAFVAWKLIDHNKIGMQNGSLIQISTRTDPLWNSFPF